MTKKFDIAIIGGSYAGMTSALSLAQISPDLKIVIIEKQDIKNHDKKPDGRGYAISNNSLKLFQKINIFEGATKDSGTIKDIKITDYKSPFFLDFLSQEVDEENFGALIESYKIHNALRNEVLKQKNITIFCPNSYKNINFDNNSVEIELDNQQKIISDLALACDGRFSELRDKFAVETKKKDFKQRAIVFNINHEKSHHNVAWEKFLPGGPLAILPLKDTHQSSIVWIVKEEIADAILNLDQENFIHQVEKKLDRAVGRVKKLGDKFSYPLIMIEAKKFYHEKLLFVGDSSCGVHPIAGQGLNLGFQSIMILTDLIEKYYLSNLEISSQSLIESYNKQAKFNAKKMAVATDLLNELFETKSITLSLARDFGLGLVNKLPKLKKFFIKNAGGF